MTRLHTLALLLLLVTTAACARALNYEDPAGPRFASVGRTDRTSLVRPTPTELRVVTFNIKYGRAIDRAIEVLRAPPLRGADVIALQEIDEEDAARVAAALHMEYVYYPISLHPLDDRHFGSAVLSAWPIERDWKVLLPYRSASRRQRRGGTAVVIRAGDVRIRIYSVHLELPLNLTPAQRTEQVARLIGDAAAAAEPVVIAGDLNGPDVAWLFEDAGYAWATRELGPTAAIFRADHVFARGLEPADAGLHPHVRGASDHLPAWVVLRLR